jgi:adenylate cyclase
VGLALSAHRRILLLRILNGLGILFLLVMHDITNHPSGILARLDLFFYDARYEHAPAQVDPRIVIVDIDERSLARTGRWPWPDERLARLNERIFEEGRPAVVGYSLFPSATGTDESGESAFAASLAGRPVVLGYYLGTGDRGVSSGQLPRPLFPPGDASPLGDGPLEATGYRANSERLASAAAQGFLNGFPGAGIDQDGTLRGLPLLARIEQGVQESFAVAVLRKYLLATSATATARTLGLHADESSLDIPVSDGYSAMIPFSRGSGPDGGRFVWISAIDLLDGWVDASVLRDRIVLVGSSADGLSAARPTPGSISTPAVEIHASLIAGALDQSIPRRMAVASVVTALILLLAGGGLAVLLPRIEPVPALAASSAVLLLLAAVNSVIDQMFGLVLPLAASLFAIVLILIFNLIFGYLVEVRSRGAVVRLFS